MPLRRIRHGGPVLRRRMRVGNLMSTAAILFLAALLVMLLVHAAGYLKKLSGEIALSDASDLVVMAVNNAIKEKMSDGQYDYGYFVTLEKDNDGNISAISANMSRINVFSSEILSEVVQAADSGELDVRIPLGNLLGMSLALGRGPRIPVDIIMLTSSHTEFRNELISSGINQTKHQIVLEIIVDVDVLIPWETLSTQIVTEALIAETVVVGSVPDTYVDLE